MTTISRALIFERSLGEEDERNVYELSFHNATLCSMLGLSGCVRLRLLDLSFNQIRTIEGIDTLVELRELRLYGNALQHVGGLACLRSLKVLLLHNNALEPPVLDMGLAQLTQLATLRVDGNEQLGAEGVAGLHLARLPQLTQLHASGVGLQVTPQLLQAALTFTLILALTLPLALIPTPTPTLTPNQATQPLREAAALEHLELERNGLTELGGLGGMRRLQEAQLGWNALTDSTLPALRALPTLAILRLEGNRLQRLAGLPTLPKLQELHLAHNQIDALDGLAAAKPEPPPSAAAAKGPPLTSATRWAPPDLEAKKADGARGGRSASAFPALELLDLSGNRLASAESLEPLLAPRRLPALAELTLHSNPACRDRAGAAAVLAALRCAAATATTTARSADLCAPLHTPSALHLSPTICLPSCTPSCTPPCTPPCIATCTLPCTPPCIPPCTPPCTSPCTSSPAVPCRCALPDELLLDEQPLGKLAERAAREGWAASAAPACRPGTVSRPGTAGGWPGTAGGRPATAGGRSGTPGEGGWHGGEEAVPLVRPPCSRRGPTVPMRTLEELGQQARPCIGMLGGQ